MRYEVTVSRTIALPVQESPDPQVTPTVSRSCLDDVLCSQVYDWTSVPWLAESSYYILVKPLRILLIIAVAMAVRYVLHRMIDRLVRTTANGSVPAILRPLRERMPTGAQDATALFPERRRQRAAAIGSVLRSFVTAAVFTVALLLVLGELNFNLAPLLASAGIVGLALGFGAQTLVKDLITGLFMLLEDQYGVGDTVDVGETIGVVEAVGLRITTVRDAQGVVWYVRNGEIIRVGNKSQGWAVVVVDMPIGYTSVDQATTVLRAAATSLAEDPEFATDFIDPPEVLGVEQITVDGAVVRTTAKTSADAQFRVVRELRRRLAEALEVAGISAKIAATRMYPRPPVPDGADAGPRGAT
ncbi:MAG TPA: mechanosensitive ion channel domain-containing protein [Pilimelia sp.]|nr:mechanosensitive ion channel domain-containing protein [Pilimelia sp.]